MINVKMQPSNAQKLSPKIAVIGVGGAGGNAINNMISSNLEGCEFLVCNTDAQALENSLCQNRIQLGTEVTGGLGAGSKPEIGRQAAEETLDEILEHLDGANMAFVTAGMGGGTGTGAAPVIAKACREKGILTVGVVTKPFHFEGSHRMKMAEQGLDEMQSYVDTLIVIPNQNLFRIANEKTTFAEAFLMADSVLQSGVRGVTDLMVRPGLVNLDFADIRTAMLEMGKAMMGTGEASGDRRAIEAAEAAINNPLLDDVSMKGAHGVIINVTGGYDMTLFEADEACNRIRDEVDPDANIIFGATFDESMEGTMRVSIVATGIDKEAMQKYRGQGGTGTTNAIGSSSSFERATPNAPKQETSMASAEVAENVESKPVEQSYTTGAQSIRGITAPATHAAAEPESDLFEQNQLTDAGMTADVAATAESLRGARVNGSFIPPKPIVAVEDMAEDEAQGAAAQEQMPMGLSAPAEPQQAQSMAQQPVSSPAVSSPTSGLSLNPPKMPAQRERAPSFLERLTGSVQQTLGGHRDEQHSTMHKAPTMGGMSGSAAAQGQLNIEEPAAQPAAKAEDELDIPAFLRRQAN